MGRIEQAIFTSSPNGRWAGYQVVAVSPGVAEMDRRELSVWGPSHDSLVDGEGSTSINFFPLPSGAYCVSRTVSAGWEYSGRGGGRVYTHCLVVPPDELARFGNHPLALARAALDTGMLDPREQIPAELPPLELSGHAPTVNESLLARLLEQVGPRRMALLVQTALNAPCVAVGGPAAAEALVAGLMDCLPPECRRAISFSTGLKYSPRRPFRVLPLPQDRAARHSLAHQANVLALDLADEPPSNVLIDDWARAIERIFASNRIPFLAAEMLKPRPDLTPDDLPALGLQMLEELDISCFREPSGNRVSAHAAHRRFQGSAATALTPAVAAPAPSKRLDPESPEVLEKLEALDDAVFEAIRGDTRAMEQMKTLWPRLRAELGDTLLAESREQYLRYALCLWEGAVDPAGMRTPSTAIQALEVLCVLFDEVP